MLANSGTSDKVLLCGFVEGEFPMSKSNLPGVGLYYHPEAYSISGPKLMGRNAAGESFLRGLLQHIKTNGFYVQLDNPAHLDGFSAAAKQFGRMEPVQSVQAQTLGKMTQAGVVFHPGPGIGAHAQQRSFWGDQAWSLCGITHTTSSARAMDAITGLLTTPVQPWDALICTSHAVKANVTALLDREMGFLQARLGASKQVLPQMPVIPLGIHTADFEFGPAARQAARLAIGLAQDEVAVLFMGRLSFHAKAHPWQMYQALEAAAKATGCKIALIECGWHANDALKEAFVQGAQQGCPSVRHITLDGRDAQNRDHVWAGADIFCSLSDNIQETFGISPIEAMAAGLPVVVSDWDGYRDSVRHGVDGFTIPTIMPRAGLAGDLAHRHALQIDSYDMYIGQASMMTSVDMRALIAAFTDLIKDPQLRSKMGSAGRARAKDCYDWGAVIPQYQALWADLNDRRSAAVGHKTQTWPARPDPYVAFAGYATHTLSEETILRPTEPTAQALMDRYRALMDLMMLNYCKRLMLPDETLQQIFAAASPDGQTAAQIIQSVPAGRRPQTLRALGLLVKIGLFERA